MADAAPAPPTQNEFWRPPAAAAPALPERISACRCGSEFIVGSLYCHSCGARRPGAVATQTLTIPGLPEVAALGERLGLNTAAVIAFLLGALCLAGAVCVSLFFSVRTPLDWQAIQLWRIEWLLGAIAAFAAGHLLKK